MPTTQPDPVLRHIRGLVASETAGGLPDGDLLTRFAVSRDEAAFEALVRRHGPLVFGVCRRVLGNAHDADDAFQATFLVLARRAASIRKQESLGSWLYRVAYRAAVRARAHAAGRHAHEAHAADRPPTDPLADVTGRELLAALDEEVQRLSERHRGPLVLCHLEGKTRDEAAAQLGLSLGTLKRRLEQARDLLRARLTRRGTALPGALLLADLAQGAAVPPALAAAAARVALPGAHPASVSALAQATLPGLARWRLRGFGLVLLVAGVLGLGATLVAAVRMAPNPAATGGVKPEAATAKPDPADDKGIVVQGRVEDATGKPVPGAQVGVLVLPKNLADVPLLGEPQFDVAASARTDVGGRYRLQVPRAAGKEPLPAILLARAPGHGFAVIALARGPVEAPPVLRLPQEQILKGRFIDLQGAPVSGLTVHVGAVFVKHGDAVDGLLEPKKPSPLWFPPVQTDQEGRFQLRGIGPGQKVAVVLRDERFNSEPLNLWATDDKRAAEVVHALAPGQVLTGRVTYADTGKPAAGAPIRIQQTRGKTDSDGRYRLMPTPQDLQAPGLFVEAPRGEPYLGLVKWLKLPKPLTKLAPVDLALPRGVLVRGKVTEAGTGKAVAGAAVYFLPSEVKNPFYREGLAVGSVFPVRSDGEGRFQIGVLPGPGYLLAKGRTNAFVPQEYGIMQLLQGKPGGERRFAHAVRPIHFQPGDAPTDVTVSLRRGVAVRGKLVGPDGQKVSGAEMLTRLSTCAWMAIEEVRGVPVPGGEFELGGCDPERAHQVVFLDEKNRWGAAVKVSGKDAGTPLTVRLQPCGAAKVRFLDRDGTPLVGHWPEVEMVFAPGPHRFSAAALKERAADTVNLANVHRQAYQLGNQQTDADGRITLPALVPGVTYWVVSQGLVLRTFTVRPGETLDLKDVTIRN